MSTDKKQDAIKAAFDLVEHQGLVIRSVSDGKLLIFKRDFLRRLLDANPDQDKLVIFARDEGSASGKKSMS